MPDENPVVPSWPPPKAAAVDPNGLQTSSTASTSAGLLLTAAGGAGAPVASALGLGTSAKVAAAGFSLATLGHGSLCAGLGLIGLGIVLNVASLVVRRQLLREYENEYIKARDERTRAAEDELRSKKSGEQTQKPPPQ